MLLCLVVAAGGVWARVELWRSGRPAPGHSENHLLRFFDLISWGLLQRGVLRDRSAAWMHTLIYVGFLVLIFTTTMVFLDHDLGLPIYRGGFYLAVTLLSDVLGAGLLIGCGLAAHRRYFDRAERLHSRPADAFLLIFLALLVAQGFGLEALRIRGTQDPWGWYSPVGMLLSGLFWPLSLQSIQNLHYLLWWFHTITVFTFLALLPYTKFFHVLASVANLYFRGSERAKGALENPGDLEKLIEAGEEFNIGLGTIKDYSWKQLLDLDACTSCGRCQDACPAYNSGKALSPKWMILDTRNHLLGLHAQANGHASNLPPALVKTDRFLTEKLLLASSGFSHASAAAPLGFEPTFRAANPLVQQAALNVGQSADARIAGEVMNADVFWSCTTCMACVEACPVGINHVDLIVGNRRNMALMQGEIPHEAQATLKALENRANPYGPPQDRANWLSALDLPALKPGDKVDYLYWVGCVSAFDPRKQKIAQALVKLMRHAGLSFGVLGNVEGCSGDPARRLGEENLFQTLAKKNIATLRTVSFKYLVANCPHCFNTIKNEYPQFGNLADGAAPEIIHHSVLLKRLISSGKLSFTREVDTKLTFHDPCYLGRYNDEYDAPRESLRAVKGLQIVEMDRSREKSMCCGAGGGHFWMDLKVGQRVNAQRTDQAAETQAQAVATACPFCLQMMEDGVKLTGREGAIEVRDIAEILADAL